MKKGTRVGCPQVQDKFSGFQRPRTPDLGLSKQQQDVSRQKRSFLYPTSKHLSLLAACWKWLSSIAHGRPERTLYCSQVESANRRLLHALQTVFPLWIRTQPYERQSCVVLRLPSLPCTKLSRLCQKKSAVNTADQLSGSRDLH